MRCRRQVRWLEGLAQFQRLFQLVGLGVGTVLALAAILTVTTATTLLLHQRRDEMEIMRLVGATESVIRLPRMLQGTAQGLVAAIIAVGGPRSWRTRSSRRGCSRCCR